MQHTLSLIFITLIGMIPDFISIFLGALGALWVARWQIRKQDKMQEQSDKKRLVLLYNRVVQELRNDWYTLKELKNVLEQSKESRYDILDWAISVGNSVSTSAYDNLLHSGLDRYLPGNTDEALYSAYNNIISISNEVRKLRLATEFNFGYRGDKQRANSEYEALKMSLTGVYHLLTEKLEIINKYKDELEKSHNKV